MKFNKFISILLITLASAFLIAGCTNDIKTNDGNNEIEIETDENTIGTGNVETSDSDVDQITSDFNDNSIDAEIELGELI